MKLLSTFVPTILLTSCAVKGYLVVTDTQNLNAYSSDLEPRDISRTPAINGTNIYSIKRTNEVNDIEDDATEDDDESDEDDEDEEEQELSDALEDDFKYEEEELKDIPQPETSLPQPETNNSTERDFDKDRTVGEEPPVNKDLSLEADTTNVIDYRKAKIYGVNLGGWLLTEPYITPSLYWAASPDGSENKVPVDEYNYCKTLGEAECHKRLKKHWDTWIVEDDFRRIRSWGFNTVRLPIGYWAFARLNGDPYCTGQEEYLQKAITWARTHGLMLWIDLHGVPGSQNGFDNSGLRDHLLWQSRQEYVDLSLQVLYYIMNKYGKSDYYDVISGIQAVNEPLGPSLNIDMIEKFYVESYIQMRAMGSKNNIVFHDAFMPATFWNYRFNGDVRGWANFSIYPGTSLTNGITASYYDGKYENVVIDHHRYEVFDVGQLKLDIDGHLAALEGYVNGLLAETKANMIGEWSAALTDCAFWLNGVNRGARYDGTFGATEKIGTCSYSNDISKLTLQDRVSLRRFIERQLDLYSRTSGFIFWCYKTETALEWDLTKLIQHDLFPQPLTDRRYSALMTNEANAAFGTVSSTNRLVLKIEFIVLILTITLCVLNIVMDNIPKDGWIYGLNREQILTKTIRKDFCY